MTVSPRIQLRNEAYEEAKRLLELTKLGNLSELMSVMIFRYGHHLETTWVVKPVPNANLTLPDPSLSNFDSDQ